MNMVMPKYEEIGLILKKYNILMIGQIVLKEESKKFDQEILLREVKKQLTKATIKNINKKDIAFVVKDVDDVTRVVYSKLCCTSSENLWEALCDIYRVAYEHGIKDTVDRYVYDMQEHDDIKPN